MGDRIVRKASGCRRPGTIRRISVKAKNQDPACKRSVRAATVTRSA